MIRDMNLICRILKYVERQDLDGRQPLEPPKIPGFEERQINEHIRLCVEAGYLQTAGYVEELNPVRLTWAGHEELARMRGQ